MAVGSYSGKLGPPSAPGPWRRIAPRLARAIIRRTVRKSTAKAAPRSSTQPTPTVGRRREAKLKKARAASSIGDWATACAIYIELTEPGAAPLGALYTELFQSLNMMGDFPGASRALEQAYRAHVDEGDELAAVRAATGLVMVHELVGDWAAARGWRQRGWRHFDNIGPCLERGYHALCTTGCDVHDPRDLLERAEMVLSIANEFKDHDLELRFGRPARRSATPSAAARRLPGLCTTWWSEVLNRLA